MAAHDPRADSPAYPTDPRVLQLTLAAVLAVGVVLRAWHWYIERSLWIDEARLALNILGRSLAGLAEPLWFDQSAPVLFLWATKLVVAFGGTSEAILRLVPVVSGIAAVPLAYRVGRAVLSAEGALLLTSVIAVSPVAIYYSNELKPYSTDLALTLWLAVVAVRSVRPGSSKASAALLVLGVVAPWASASMFFVFPACLLAIWFGQRTEPRRIIAVAVAWGCSAAAAWFVTYRPLSANTYLGRYWAFRLWDPGPQWGERVWTSLVEVTGGTMMGVQPTPHTIGGWPSIVTGFTLVVASIGLYSIRTRGRALTAIVILPLSLVAVAAVVGFYPFSLRLLLFALPLILTLFAAGIERCITLLPRDALRRTAWVILGFGVAGPQFIRALANAVEPEVWAPVRELVQEMRATGESGRPTYVAAGVLPTWVYYTMDWSSIDRSRLEAAASAGSSGGYALENGGRTFGNRTVAPPAVGPAGRIELWGRATGLEWVAGSGFTYAEPYDGWAQGEAERIAQSARPVIWVVSSQVFGTEALLHDAIRTLGLCEVEHVGGERASAILYRRVPCATS